MVITCLSFIFGFIIHYFSLFFNRFREILPILYGFLYAFPHGFATKILPIRGWHPPLAGRPSLGFVVSHKNPKKQSWKLFTFTSCKIPQEVL